MKDYRESLLQMKADLKQAAEQIREGKGNSHLCRIKHVAYCLMRGRAYHQMEPKVRPYNELYRTEILSMISAYFGAEARSHFSQHIPSDSKIIKNFSVPRIWEVKNEDVHLSA